MDLGLLVYLFVYGSNRVDVGSVRYTQVAEGHGPLRREEGTEWLLVITRLFVLFSLSKLLSNGGRLSTIVELDALFDGKRATRVQLHSRI